MPRIDRCLPPSWLPTRRLSRRGLLQAAAGALAVAVPWAACGRAWGADPPGGRGTPAPFALDYDGYLDLGGAPMRIARGHLEFAPGAGEYTLALRVDSAIAQLSYESVGVLDRDGLHPLRYLERRRVGGRSPRERSVRFVTEGKAAGGGAADPPADNVVTVPADAQDRVSVLVQLSLLARRAPKRFVDGAQFEMPLAGLEHVDRIRLRVGAAERVETAAGPRDAMPVRRTGETGGAAGLEFWLGTDAQCTPVVIRFDDDGRSLKFVLR